MQPVDHAKHKVNSSLEKSFSANYGSVYLKEFPGHSDDLCLKNILPMQGSVLSISILFTSSVFSTVIFSKKDKNSAKETLQFILQS